MSTEEEAVWAVSKPKARKGTDLTGPQHANQGGGASFFLRHDGKPEHMIKDYGEGRPESCTQRAGDLIYLRSEQGQLRKSSVVT